MFTVQLVKNSMSLIMETLKKIGGVTSVPAAIVYLLLSANVNAQTSNEYNILQECMKLSGDNTDVNNCMDNYLDLMDDNITDISEYIARDLDDRSLDMFQLSQQAFFEYRKQNCLWYLEFSTPDPAADIIAKNCLAEMSQQRLSELQTLIATDNGKAGTLRGFYVYGANRNSFQPCGSEQRYWVEGDNGQVGQLQQDYLSQSTASLQVLYVELRGQIEPSEDYEEHSGVVNLVAVTSLRPPSDSACSLPVGSTANTLATLPEVKPVPVPDSDPAPTTAATEDEPEQFLRAYFGEWLAECKQNRSEFTCEVSVGFKGESDEQPQLLLARRSEKRTLVYMNFPDQEIDSPSKIHWRVDTFYLRDIIGSEIRVDEVGTQQLVHERKYVRDELLPLLRDGTQVSVEVFENVDDTKGDRYAGTLQGLTRALNFADDFIESGGNL